MTATVVVTVANGDLNEQRQMFPHRGGDILYPRHILIIIGIAKVFLKIIYISSSLIEIRSQFQMYFRAKAVHNYSTLTIQ